MTGGDGVRVRAQAGLGIHSSAAGTGKNQLGREEKEHELPYLGTGRWLCRTFQHFWTGVFYFLIFFLNLIFMWQWAVSPSVLPSCRVGSSSSLNHFLFTNPSCSCCSRSSCVPPVLSAPPQSPSQILPEEMAPQKCRFSISAAVPITPLWPGRISVPSSVV